MYTDEYHDKFCNVILCSEMEWDFVEYQNKMPFRGIVTGKAIMTMIGWKGLQ